MRRSRLMALAAAAAIGAGTWSGVSGLAQAQAPAARGKSAADHLRDAARALRAFEDKVVPNAYDSRPARLRSLQPYVDRVGAAVAGLGRSSGARRHAQTLRDLRDAHRWMQDYMRRGRAGDEMRMQIAVWRFLWVLNRLPGR